MKYKILSQFQIRYFFAIIFPLNNRSY